MQPHLELVLGAASGHHTTPVNSYQHAPHFQMCDHGSAHHTTPVNSCHHSPRFEVCDDGSDHCPHVKPLSCHQPRHSFVVLPAVTAWPPETPAAAEVLAVSPACQLHPNAG